MIWLNLDERGGAMPETPSTMKSVEYIQDLLDELVRREIHQTETITATQNEILTAIKDVENAIESLHSTYRSTHNESTPVPELHPEPVAPSGQHRAPGASPTSRER
jgi:hypothetical protein